MTGPRLTITLETSPSDADTVVVRQGLYDYSNQRSEPADHQLLTLFLRDGDGRLAGGLLGETYWHWLHVNILWLREDVRGWGYGGALLDTAEAEAMRRGCHSVFLDTLSFQARPFYEKRGYALFGRLEDFPPGHQRYYLQKRLVP